MLRICACCILTSSRITRSGSWKTDRSFLRWFCHNDSLSYHLVMGVEELLQISAMALERLGTLLHQGVKGGLDDVVLVEVRSIDARASLLHA
jgi:hypothetical protein